MPIPSDVIVDDPKQIAIGFIPQDTLFKAHTKYTNLQIWKFT